MKISFIGKPDNYAIIDNYVSRSAQPKKEDFVWLKKQGVTDIVNFRTMVAPALDFDESKVVQELGMKYHNIPSISKYPTEQNISTFLQLVDKISADNGKMHIHCKQGADRTGMYSFIYKAVKNIGTTSENTIEWIQKGLHLDRYPDLISWTLNFLKKYKQ